MSLSTMCTSQISDKYKVKTIVTTGEKLYLNEKMSDFRFIFSNSDGTYEQVPVHKMFLTSASEVFDVLFREDWKKCDEAELFDVSAAAFKDFLQFFYLQEVSLTLNNVAMIMCLAAKYSMTECSSICREFLMNTFTSDTIVIGYALAIVLEDTKFIEACEQRIQQDALVAFESSSFLECDKNILARILKLENLQCNGMETVEACMSWLRYASYQEYVSRDLIEEYLGELFYEMPFGSMSIDDFAVFNHVYEDLLTPEEYEEVLQMIVFKHSEPKTFKQSKKYDPSLIPKNM